jgi:photosystem II stability/assembly factor-like uncharacterized protein
MKKTLILILALPFLAASCNSGDIFNFNSGSKGVFKSEDNGETFALASNLVGKGNIANLSINAMAYEPGNPDVLYVGSSSGIHKSEDAANSWTYILSGIAISSISVDRFAPATVFAAGISGTNGKIIKSVDGGTTWVDIYSEPSKNNSVLAVGVSSTSSNTVLAGLNNGELIRSTDAGRTWQVSKDFSDRVIKIKFGASAAYALTAKNGLFVSTDLGLTWNSLSTSMVRDTLNSINNSSVSVSAFYDVGLDAKQSVVLYLGTEQGLFRTVNNGDDWSLISLPVRNAALRISAISVNPTNSNNLFTSISSTLYKSVNGGLTWETKPLPSSASIHIITINPLSTNLIYLGLRTQ